MDVERFRKLLEERRRLKIETIEGLCEAVVAGRLDASGEKPGDRAEREAVELAEIDEALFRIERGTYGVCERCGRPIENERLEPRPQATRCAEDARREEAA